MSDYKEKYIRPTKRYLGHTAIRIRGKHIGFIIRGKEYAPHNWYFICELPSINDSGENIHNLNAENRKLLVKKIKEKYYVNQ